MGKKIRRRLRKAGERMQPGLGRTRPMPGRTDDDYRYRPQPAPGGNGGGNFKEVVDRFYQSGPGERPGSGGVVTLGGGIDDIRRSPAGPPSYRNGDRVSIPRRPEAQPSPGGKRPPMRPQPSPGMPPRAPEPRPNPGRGGRGPVARPQPFPMPGGNDVRDIRGTNDPRNRKKRGRNSGGGIRY